MLEAALLDTMEPVITDPDTALQLEDATKSLIAALRRDAGDDCGDPWQPRTLVEFNLGEFHYTLIRKRSNLHQRLSPRELEIARLIASGMSNKSIGAVLDISTWTVAAHIRRMFAKLGVVTRAALVARLSTISIATWFNQLTMLQG